MLNESCWAGCERPCTLALRVKSNWMLAVDCEASRNPALWMSTPRFVLTSLALCEAVTVPCVRSICSHEAGEGSRSTHEYELPFLQSVPTRCSVRLSRRDSAEVWPLVSEMANSCSATCANAVARTGNKHPWMSSYRYGDRVLSSTSTPPDT
eukprot:4609604-Prymnesium_polylepis.1